MPIKEYCEKYLEYRDGELYWKERPSPRVVVGNCATRNRKDGYRQIKIQGKMYLVHRIVWLMHYGKFPENTIDHIDRVRDNNRIENIRDITINENLTNRGKGYYWCKRERKFLVYKTVDSKKVYIGRADTEAEAAEIRSKACE